MAFKEAKPVLFLQKPQSEAGNCFSEQNGTIRSRKVEHPEIKSAEMKGEARLLRKNQKCP